MNLEWDLALRIVLSGILGAVIGYERQARHKAAGLRTHKGCPDRRAAG